MIEMRKINEMNPLHTVHNKLRDYTKSIFFPANEVLLQETLMKMPDNDNDNNNKNHDICQH